MIISLLLYLGDILTITLSTGELLLILTFLSFFLVLIGLGEGCSDWRFLESRLTCFEYKTSFEARTETSREDFFIW